ncbi:HU family DNA-binding protein [Dethiobacter alkaliphilus]|uniref:Histone family protein DNA-binding protein n=1 Tax=Dethiobacter alkaliphilus AHT 1 TaxID=555088 RepID=C0GE87_DETAL|nr:HU family DNA-binding protein [Dethiobacter alkaliphilus]EEG78381.1 histone family protein DNA-binding protein [Dethiobacter alkaliphilus AHT 1]
MIKTDVARSIAEKLNIQVKDAETTVNGLIDTITESLSAGEAVKLAGFGTFDLRHAPERAARNPKTGETVQVPATHYPTFRAVLA